MNLWRITAVSLVFVTGIFPMAVAASFPDVCRNLEEHNLPERVQACIKLADEGDADASRTLIDYLALYQAEPDFKKIYQILSRWLTNKDAAGVLQVAGLGTKRDIRAGLQKIENEFNGCSSSGNCKMVSYHLVRAVREAMSVEGRTPELVAMEMRAMERLRVDDETEAWFLSGHRLIPPERHQVRAWSMFEPTEDDWSNTPENAATDVIRRDYYPALLSGLEVQREFDVSMMIPRALFGQEAFFQKALARVADSFGRCGVRLRRAVMVFANYDQNKWVRNDMVKPLRPHTPYLPIVITEPISANISGVANAPQRHAPWTIVNVQFNLSRETIRIKFPQTLAHEIGHALGLDHPIDSDSFVPSIMNYEPLISLSFTKKDCQRMKESPFLYAPRSAALGEKPIAIPPDRKPFKELIPLLEQAERLVNSGDDWDAAYPVLKRLFLISTKVSYTRPAAYPTEVQRKDAYLLQAVPRWSARMLRDYLYFRYGVSSGAAKEKLRRASFYFDLLLTRLQDADFKEKIGQYEFTYADDSYVKKLLPAYPDLTEQEARKLHDWYLDTRVEDVLLEPGFWPE